MVRVIILLLFPLNLFAQQFYPAPLQGMGNTGMARPTVYSVSYNPAILPYLNTIEAAIAYQPHYLSHDLRSQALYVGMPFSQYGIGIALENYGIPEVSSLSKVSAAFGRRFGPRFSSAVMLNYHGFHVKNVVSERTYSLDLGVYLQLKDQLAIGALAKNIANTNYSDLIDVSVDRMIGMGMNYNFSSALSITSDLLYSDHKKLIYRLGMQYGIGDKFMLRTGLDTNPMLLTAGIGIRLNALSIDFSATFHNRLGTSPQVALAYAF